MLDVWWRDDCKVERVINRWACLATPQRFCMQACSAPCGAVLGSALHCSPAAPVDHELGCCMEHVMVVVLLTP